MAHLKLIFPGLSNSNSLCNLLLGHSALSSLIWHAEDQGCETISDQNKKRCDSFKKISLRWRRFHQQRRTILPQRREKIQNLSFVQDVDSNDFWSSQSKDSQFVHALQLQQQEYTLNDVETVNSQRWTNSRKCSISSQTQSLEFIQSMIIE